MTVLYEISPALEAALLGAVLGALFFGAAYLATSSIIAFTARRNPGPSSISVTTKRPSAP